MRSRSISLSALAVLSGCTAQHETLTSPPPLSALANDAAGARADGLISGSAALDHPIFLDSAGAQPSSGGADHAPAEPAVYTLNFQNGDIRDIARSVLGGILKVNYLIDPTVRGTGTIATAVPVTRTQAFQMLDTLLQQNGATLVAQHDFYRIVPVASVNVAGAGGSSLGGTELLPLHYARAEDLATLLHQYASEGVLITAVPDQNALLLGGDGNTRAALVALIRQLDTDALGDVSYALFPVTSGDPADLAVALRAALRTPANAGIGDAVRVIPLDRIDAVLVAAHTQVPLAEAKRIFGLIEAARRTTARSWHAHYIENGDSEVVARVLLAAFPPTNVSVEPADKNADVPAAEVPDAPPLPDANNRDGRDAPPAAKAPKPPAEPAPTLADETATQSKPDQMRIVPYKTRNAIMTYSTATEEATIAGLLAKIDLLPMQVRIDAVFAEVTTTDTLTYGTQFLLPGKLEKALITGSTGSIAPSGPGFSIFRIGGQGNGYALSMLADAGTVRVLSSPQITVMDNTVGGLVVGSLVPYLSGNSQSLVSDTATVVNNVSYAQTGVVMQIRPHLGNNGLVTLELAQELDGAQNTASSSIDSPTFSTRSIQSKVTIQDGQTIAVAGITSDNVSRSNSGIPLLKDIPVLGAATSTQDNERTRTNVLLLVTPHIIRNQNSARALTDDLRAGLGDAARTPQELRTLPPSGSANPNAAVTR